MATPLKPEDLCRFRWLTDVVALDGHQAVFGTEAIRDDRKGYVRSLWLVAEGHDPRPLTSGAAQDTAPRPSPDGRSLAFLSDRSGKAELWLLPLAEGGEARPLTTLGGGVGEAVWSPDGTRIAFVARRAPEGEPAPNPLHAEDVKVFRRPRYKFDGQGLLYPERYGQIGWISVDNPSEVHWVTSGHYDHQSAAWSPDGHRIAFSATRVDDPDHAPFSDIWVSDGSTLRKLTESLGPAHDPVWSRDGRSIAYLGHEEGIEQWALPHVYLVNAAGGEKRRDLTPQGLDYYLGNGVVSDFRVGGSIPALAYSAEGDELLLPITPGRTVQILALRTDGSGATRTALGGTRHLFALSYAKDMTHYVAGIASGTEPGDVYFGELGKQEHRASHLNPDLLVAEPEYFQFEARDGQAIDAWLMRPIGMAARCAAILNVHGGPGLAFGESFFFEHQLMAAAGYAVLYCNPRGSGCYGREFQRAIDNAWGTKDYEDCMDCVDAALQRYPFLDAARLGVCGGSYGGYMTNWVTGHTDRFACAVTDRCISNMMSQMLYSDFGFRRRGRPDPWADPEGYLNQSPIMSVHHVRAPTLIIHSEQDHRCPMGEGELWYNALTRLGVETVFVRYPDESHSMGRIGRPDHRIDRFVRYLDWFTGHIPT